MPRAIVFDFDGVIANSEPLHFRAFRDVLTEAGVDLTEADYCEQYLGFDDRGLFQAIARDRGQVWSAEQLDDLFQRKARRFEALEHDASVLFPGAEAAIRRLSSRCPVAIASGARREEIVRTLDREGLGPLFSAIVAAEDTAVSKPAPDPYIRAVHDLAAAAGIALAASDCVAIEDSQWGIESAGRAGLRTVAITNSYPRGSLSHADVIVDHLDELTWELLSSLT